MYERVFMKKVSETVFNYARFLFVKVNQTKNNKNNDVK